MRAAGRDDGRRRVGESDVGRRSEVFWPRHLGHVEWRRSRLVDDHRSSNGRLSVAAMASPVAVREVRQETLYHLAAAFSSRGTGRLS